MVFRSLIFQIIFSAFLLSGTAFAAGTLEVTQYAHSGRVPLNGVRVPLITINATAQGGDVQISEVIVRRRGLSAASDFGRLIAITDGYRRSLNAHIDNDDLATLRFRNPLVVEDGTTEKITVYANLDFETNGRTMFFTLEEIKSDAEENNLLTTPRVFTPITETPSGLTVRVKEKKSFRIKCVNRVCQKIPR